MGEFVEKAFAYMQDAGSGLIHAVPALQGPAARRFTRLTGPHDRLLRWRVARGTVERFGHSNWQGIGGAEGAKENDLTTWELVEFGVWRDYLEDTVEHGGRPAVAYRRVGSAVTMIGVRELDPKDDFLRPINREGHPNPAGEYLGVVMRGGEHLAQMAIGTATRNGREFGSLPTLFLRNLVEVPEGLYRV